MRITNHATTICWLVSWAKEVPQIRVRADLGLALLQYNGSLNVHWPKEIILLANSGSPTEVTLLSAHGLQEHCELLLRPLAHFGWQIHTFSWLTSWFVVFWLDRWNINYFSILLKRHFLHLKSCIMSRYALVLLGLAWRLQTVGQVVDFCIVALLSPCPGFRAWIECKDKKIRRTGAHYIVFEALRGRKLAVRRA